MDKMIEIITKEEFYNYHIDKIYNDCGYITFDFYLLSPTYKIIAKGIFFEDILDIEKLIVVFRPNFISVLQNMLLEHIRKNNKDSLESINIINLEF